MYIYIYIYIYLMKYLLFSSQEYINSVINSIELIINVPV